MKYLGALLALAILTISGVAQVPQYQVEAIQGWTDGNYYDRPFIPAFGDIFGFNEMTCLPEGISKADVVLGAGLTSLSDYGITDGVSKSAMSSALNSYTPSAALATQYTSSAAFSSAIAPLATSSSVSSAIGSATTPLATSASVSLSVSAATAGLASTSSVNSSIAAATAALATSSSVASSIASATSGLATSSGVTASISAATSGLMSTSAATAQFVHSISGSGGVSITGTFPNLVVASSAPTLIQRVRATTDSSGNYTWTYPTAFGAGVAPIVSVTCETSSGTQLFNAQYSPPSNTSVIVHTGYSALLGLTFGGACTVSITAMTP